MLILRISSGILISYLIGSIPTAYLIGKFWGKIDIRTIGSGNVGATNTFRAMGKIPGIVVLIFDIFKGMLAPILVADLVNLPDSLWRVVFSLAVVSGHVWTVFLKFKGGKGVATSVGALIGLSVKIAGLRPAVLISIGSWILAFLITGIVSLSSLIAALSLPISMVLFGQELELIILSAILCVFIYLRHTKNIKRMLKKEEPRVKIFK